MDIIAKLAEEFHIRTAQVEQTVALIDEGNTIPFIARYRKEVTGGLSDVVLRDLDERLKYLRNLEERKEEVIRLIDEQGKLTDELSAAIENAQTSVESRNFQYRKSTLEYDDVMNKQREIIYGQRKQVLDGMDIKPTILNMLRSSIESQVAFAFGEHDKTDDEHRADALKSCEGTYFPRGAVAGSSLAGLSAEDLTERFYAAAESYYEAKENAVTSPIMRELERVVLLRVVDEYWMDHIDAMSELRQAIRLQSYGNNKPIDVYKQESLTMFEDMIAAIQGDTVRRIFSARVKTEGEVKRERVADGIVASTSGDGTVKKQPRKVQKIGRNDPCPCGSGKKYKQCCGR